MKIERTKNATRNMIFGMIQKIYEIAVPFLMRTAMIYIMGVKYLGLNSLFSSILQVLNLVELGVGRAMVYSMYKPIAEDNVEEICALMRLYKIYYRIIGFVIGGVGIILLPAIPYLIKGEVPAGINVYIIYLLNLGATVLSYWLFAYRNCLLNAYQRNDIINKIMLITNSVQYALQLMVLIFLRNYYLYLIILLGMQAVTNIVTACVTVKLYPMYKPEGKLDSSIVKNINCKIKDLFTSKVGGVVVNSADTIVISAFLGIEILAIYQNYFYILSSIIGFVSIIFSSCTAGIGNSIIVETKEKNYNDLKVFSFLIAWIAGWCSCCLLCLYQPFMNIWVGDKLCLNYLAVICFCLYYFIYEINQLLNLYKDAAGIWHEDRFRPLTTALANLVMNLIMVQYWGIYGVLLSTVLSNLIVGMPWLLHNLFTTIFEWKYLFNYLKRMVLYVMVVFCACVVTFFICSCLQLSESLTLFVRAGICCVVPNIIFLICYWRMSEFKQCIMLVDRITQYKFHLSKLFDE